MNKNDIILSRDDHSCAICGLSGEAVIKVFDEDSYRKPWIDTQLNYVCVCDVHSSITPSLYVSSICRAILYLQNIYKCLGYYRKGQSPTHMGSVILSRKDIRILTSWKKHTDRFLMKNEQTYRKELGTTAEKILRGELDSWRKNRESIDRKIGFFDF